jgi:hypothetical protein
LEFLSLLHFILTRQQQKNVTSEKSDDKRICYFFTEKLYKKCWHVGRLIKTRIFILQHTETENNIPNGHKIHQIIIICTYTK